MDGGLEAAAARGSLTPAAFDRLLAMLDPDRIRAGDLYERLRVKLMFMFESRGCPFPADLTDATFDRVAQILERNEETIRDVVGYVCRVAQFMLKEDYRAPTRKWVPIDSLPLTGHPVRSSCVEDDSAQRERIYEAFVDCLDRLAASERALVTEYYQGEKRAKKDARVQLAQSLGITMNALSLRAFRIRRTLQACINGRLDAR